jgi:dolichol-phosphate mannosyltransferase
VLKNKKIGVIIPCYKVSMHICNLIKKLGAEIDLIVVVDDCCPEKSGYLVENTFSDPRIRILYHSVNLGVGGAVLTGYQVAIEAGCTVMVKLDGDGQMEPALIRAFIAPILNGKADYTKGNRFFWTETVWQMPRVRLIGNIGLSFLTKLSSGYWNLFDPTNGFTAISAKVAEQLPFKKIDHRYFFESDMLFRLNLLRAVVIDIPMHAKYGNEKSNLRVPQEIPRFIFKNLFNMSSRIISNYFIRNFNYASIELLIGIPSLLFGITFGAFNWVDLSGQGTLASAGTVMLAALPVILGFQMLLGFVNYDMVSIPSRPIQDEFVVPGSTNYSAQEKV